MMLLLTGMRSSANRLFARSVLTLPTPLHSGRDLVDDEAVSERPHHVPPPPPPVLLVHRRPLNLKTRRKVTTWCSQCCVRLPGVAATDWSRCGCERAGRPGAAGRR